MTYKNETKGYFVLGAMYGLPMGIFLGLINRSVVSGILVAIFGGLLFGFLMFLFNRPAEKKFFQMRAELEKEKTIICDGTANILKTPGWIFLTETELLFYPRKMNASSQKIAFPLSDIKKVTVQNGRLFITTDAETPIMAVVCRPDAWKMHIEAAIAKAVQKNPSNLLTSL